MSKKRSLINKSNQFLLDKSLDQKRLRNISPFGAETIKSKYIPEYNRKTISNLGSANLTDYHKQKQFNKNISYFRQSFNQNDPSQLPFMSSLRNNKNKYQSSCQMKKSSTICQPFNAGEKTTSNMRFRKVITDMYGKGVRMSKAYYRWHNKSGTGIKQEANFQCTLRDYNKSWAANPQETNFDNLFKPITYTGTESKCYEHNQLICPRQRKLFRIK